MTFWDRAWRHRRTEGSSGGRAGPLLVVASLEVALHEGRGLSVNTATLALQLFATERLRTLGDAVTDFCGLDVKTIQPRLKHSSAHAQARTSITEDELYARVFERFSGDSQNRAPARPFQVAAVCEACEVALAQHLEEPSRDCVPLLKPAGRAVRRRRRRTRRSPARVSGGVDVNRAERKDRYGTGRGVRPRTNCSRGKSTLPTKRSWRRSS